MQWVFSHSTYFKYIQYVLYSVYWTDLNINWWVTFHITHKLTSTRITIVSTITLTYSKSVLIIFLSYFVKLKTIVRW